MNQAAEKTTYAHAKKIASAIHAARKKNTPVCFTCDRVSSRKQEDNTSLRAQKERGLKYAQEKGFAVAHNYSFVESASKKTRPNFHAMMHDAVKFDVDILVFKTVDRLARNLPDIQLVLDFIYEHGRQVHLYDDGLRLTPAMDSNDALNFMLKGVLAKGETDRLGQRIRRAYDFKVENGVKPGKAIFGYRYDPKSLKHEFDPETKPILDFIFHTFDSQDISCQELAELLNKKGYPTGERQTTWTGQNLHKLLINPTYHGEFYARGDLIRADRKHHDIYYPKSRYEVRLKKLDLRRSGRKENKKSDPLARFLRCARCGTTL
ncbi:MAG: recombinase family protein, partial [Gammaproteobacteria bacterium]|nr:recombinase family protein [Gammaproteobacteria bacterium]